MQRANRSARWWASRRLRCSRPAVGCRRYAWLTTALCVALATLSTGAFAADWTFLVYLDADNDLHSFGLDDLDEMQQIGSSAEVNVVVQWDGWGLWGDNMGGTKRYLITPGQRILVQDLGELNMGAPQTLADFVDWGMTQYPASHYALVLWNHGAGWRSRAKAPATTHTGPAYKAVCWDYTSGTDPLYMAEVRAALQQVQAKQQKVDVLGFDACLMGMVEVAAEISGQANFMVASEADEPGQGWPYNIVLQTLTNTPGTTPGDFANAVVDSYAQSYGSWNNVTMAAIDLSAVPGVVTAVDGFANTLLSNWDSRFAQARSQTLSFDVPDHIDLYRFAELVGGSVPNVSAAADNLKTALSAAVRHEWHSGDMTGANGLAVYFPANVPSSWPGDYNPSIIRYAGETLWDEFLTLYYDPAPSAPLLNALASVQVGDAYTISWSAAADPDGIAAYGLQESTRYEVEVSDDAEGDTSAWAMTGFGQSTDDYHAGTHSYYSGSGNRLDNRLQLSTGIPVPSGHGVSLSFWAWYDIEDGYDYGYAEMSTDGVTWTPLTSFTGQSQGWHKYQFELESLTGNALWVRFRYVTDTSVDGTGLYIDDIEIATYEPFTTLSSTLGAMSYKHRGHTSPGTYYYRVRARDVPGKWGPWSNVQSLEISRPPVVTIAITPDPAEITAGETYQFRATGYDADGVEIPGVTFSWSVVHGGGSIDTTGTFTATTTAGTFKNTVVASADGRTATATVNVVAGSLKSISVSPAPAEVPAGKTQTFTATGYDKYRNEVSDLTVTWSVVNGGGTIDTNTGLFTAQTTVGEFTQTVQAKSGSVTGLATVKVVPDAVAKVEVTPNPGTVDLGAVVQFAAKAYDQYNNEVTDAVFQWTLSGGGTIDDKGLVQAGAEAGQFDDAVTATIGSISGSASLIVNAWYEYNAGKQLVTVPTTLTGLDAATLFGTRKLARWDAASEAYLTYASSPFTVCAGQGYVANLPQRTKVHVPGEPPTGDFQIDLGAAGWHLLGNPYAVPMEWNVDAIRYRQSGGSLSPLRNVMNTGSRPVEFYVWKLAAADGSWHPVCGQGILPSGESGLGVGEGAWIYTAESGVKLCLAAPGRARPTRQTHWTPTADNWAVELVVHAPGACDRSNFVGMTTRFGRNGLQLPAPPDLGAERFVDLRLAPANQGGLRSLAVSLCGAGQTRAVWNLDVTTNLSGEPVTLSWPDLGSVPRTWSLRLIDPVAGRTLSMRTARSYTFSADKSPVSRRSLRLEVVPAWESRLQLSALTVNGAARGGNTLQASFVLSRDAALRWTLRSAAGRGVAVGGETTARAGINSLPLVLGRSNRRLLPAGVYVLELIATDDEHHTVRAIHPVILR